MKNILVLFIVGLLCTTSFTGCREYVSLTNANKISQLKGNPFIFNLSKSLLKNTAKFMTEKGLRSAVSKINLLTPLSAIVSDPQHLGGFQDMLSTAYQIPSGKLGKVYSSFSSVKDLIYFVANNGQKFNFYSN